MGEEEVQTRGGVTSMKYQNSLQRTSTWGGGEAEIGAWLPQGYGAIRKYTDNNRIQISHCWRRELQIFKREKLG